MSVICLYFVVNWYFSHSTFTWKIWLPFEKICPPPCYLQTATDHQTIALPVQVGVPFLSIFKSPSFSKYSLETQTVNLTAWRYNYQIVKYIANKNQVFFFSHPQRHQKNLLYNHHQTNIRGELLVASILSFCLNWNKRHLKFSTVFSLG